MQPCAGTPANATAFTWSSVGQPAASAGKLVVTASPSLCVGISGTNPTSGDPNLALVPCNAADASQDFIWFSGLTGGLMSVTTGMFFDITGGTPTPGTRVGLYQNTGGPNQRWSYAPATGAWTSDASATACLAAC